MHEHPLYHPPADKTAIWEGRIHFAGTETATESGGYLEGALAAAQRAAVQDLEIAGRKFRHPYNGILTMPCAM